MLPANDAELKHPFWYARVLGIYHALVAYNEEGSSNLWTRVDVVWVRWFGLESGSSTREGHHLPKIGFIPLLDDGAFGFVHPREIIRACHIVPAFADGLEETAESSFVQDKEGDYNYYYVMK